jgi:hypothetical protein
MLDQTDKLELLARLVPYVADDDEDFDLVDFAQMIADRVAEDYA